MPDGMDYALVERTVLDGLGKIFDTTPGSPDTGSYVTEATLLAWIKGKTLVPGYLYNGVWYSDSGHTTPVTGEAGSLYVELEEDVLYRWDGVAFSPMSDAQLREDIQDGTVTAKKAECDASGNTISTTYATKAEAANLQAQLDRDNARLDNLEQAHGSYDVQNYKDGAITPSGKGNWAVVEGLRGVSRVENQIADIADGSSGTGNTIGTHFTTYQSSHFYLFALRATFPTQPTSGGGSSSPSTPVYLGLWNSALTSFKRHPFAYQASGSYAFVGNGSSLDGNLTDGTSANIVLQTFPNSGELCSYADVIVRDLNVYFGTSDLSFLGNTDSAKLATIQTNYPHLLIPSDYGVRIVDSSYSGVNSIGFNRFDKTEITTGKVIDYTGVIVDGTGLSVSDFMPIQSGGHYYLKSTAIVNVYQVHYYDVGKNWIGRALGSTSNTDFYALAGACYVRININTSNADDVSFNVSDSSLNGQTFPYMESTLSLTFNGRSAGSVYDSCEPNVEVGGVARKRTTQRIGSYTFTGDETFTSQSVGRVYTSVLRGTILPAPSRNTKGNILVNGFITIAESAVESGSMQVGVNNYGDIAFCLVQTSSAGSVDDLKTYLQTHPTTINFECAEYVETLSDPILDNTLLTEAGGRMATVQTGTVVDGSYDMGFINL